MRYLDEYDITDKDEIKKLIKFYIVLLGIGSIIFILVILSYLGILRFI